MEPIETSGVEVSKAPHCSSVLGFLVHRENSSALSVFIAPAIGGMIIVLEKISKGKQRGKGFVKKMIIKQLHRVSIPPNVRDSLVENTLKGIFPCMKC